MRGKISWLIVSSLALLSLVATACAPAVVEKPEVIEKPKPEVVEKPKVVEPVVEKPKYGGVLNVIIGNDMTAFDDIVNSSHSGYTLMLTNEPLISGDWAKGPAGGYGSNETTWQERALHEGLMTGYLVESWEFPTKMEGDTATLTFHIRKGVNFGLNPQSEASRLVGGREMTTDDVLYSLELNKTEPQAWYYTRSAEIREAELTSPAPWTIKIESPWEVFEGVRRRYSNYMHIFPKEVYEKWGPLAFSDWKKSVGTGPFILTNNVAGSSATLVKNPNYWMKDPVGPGKGDQLPYLDGVKILVITDKSTQLAALRTGKVDVFWEKGELNWEEGLFMKKTAPPFMRVEPGIRSAVAPLQFKLDRPPFNDIRVRQAMHMAIDFETINRELYDGLGLIHSYPVVYPEDYPEAYLALDDPEMPSSVKELYVYNPEKAKQLLAEAGYPQGFKTTLYMGSSAEDIDYWSIYKDYWRKIGVAVEFRPQESGALSTTKSTGNWEGLMTAGSVSRLNVYTLAYWYGTALNNTSKIDDPKVNEAFDKINAILFFDRNEGGRIYRELLKYVYDQVWGIPKVAEPSWQPWPVWLKNYSGERTVSAGVNKDYYRWVWIDQELKKSLGY